LAPRRDDHGTDAAPDATASGAAPAVTTSLADHASLLSAEHGTPTLSARADARRKTWGGIDQGNVMSMELLSAVLLWAGVGYLVDRWLGTEPWFLAIGALLGNAAGIYLIYLRSRRMDGVRAEDQRRPLGASTTAPSRPTPGGGA
jgi:F0F1-type ATP synthase assembly protein I